MLFLCQACLPAEVAIVRRLIHGSVNPSHLQSYLEGVHLPVQPPHFA